jgi:glyoxalase family protein
MLHAQPHLTPGSQAAMKLEGIHHVTAITADGPRNVEFYARVLGLRLAKKTVNQDDPTAYHLFYTGETGHYGSDLTFFEYPGAARGEAGAGMANRVVYRVPSAESLDYWAERLGDEGVETRREDRALRFEDPEGMGLELAVSDVPDEPLVANSAQVPDEHALQGFEAVRAGLADTGPTEALLRDTMYFEELAPHDWETRGSERGGRLVLEPASGRGRPGAGTIHHVAFTARDEEHEAWRERVAQSGLHPTPVIDRFYFRSVYFREPGGILFELATPSPGFSADEPIESLGERLSLPPDYEPLREKLEGVLTPLPDTRPWRRAGTRA